ncbi:MAG: hypothetical protein JJ992_10740, partial [Planctomycetes bacterium]|nr:hypothetical protein [Planctomycetota bacterium]
ATLCACGLIRPPSFLYWRGRDPPFRRPAIRPLALSPCDFLQQQRLADSRRVSESHRNADLIALSDDGGTSLVVLHLLDTSGHLSFDLDAVAAGAGLSLVEDFQIKFQPYDNGPYGADGRPADADPRAERLAR